MLPKKNRLSRREFSDVFRLGVRIHGPILSLHFFSDGGAKSFRAGVAVAKNAFRTNVERNRLRRIGYRLLVPYASFARGRYVLTVSREARRADRGVLSRAVASLMRRAGAHLVSGADAAR